MVEPFAGVCRANDSGVTTPRAALRCGEAGKKIRHGLGLLRAFKSIPTPSGTKRAAHWSNRMQRLVLPTQFKAAGDGTLSGHASIFGNVDLQGDVVVPGAFKEIVTNAEGRIPLLWQHDTQKPIGVATVAEDAKGLAFAAKLVLDDPLAKTARAHVKAGSVRGVSIGFSVLEGGARFVDGVRHLVALKLYEISLVTFAANPLAGVESVKSRAELEQAAREFLGLSKSQARRLAFAGWPAISSGDDGPDAADFVELFNSIK